MGSFLQTIGLSASFGTSFGILAVSTFLLTTLDTGTRLARYIFEEFFNYKSKYSRFISTGLTLVAPLAFTFIPIYNSNGDIVPAWKAVWPVFGATNQLLAGLALLVVYVWLRQMGKKTIFVVIPMLFMLVMTLWALVQLIYQSGFTAIGIIAFFLLLLAIVLVVEAAKTVFAKSTETSTN